MILLSPPKLLMILVIALIVLGPDKLPSTARRIGAMWSEFGRWRAHVESEVRATFPDLPSTTEIAKAVRSPIAMLDRLAEEHSPTPGSAGAGPPPPPGPEPSGPEPSVPPRARPAAATVTAAALDAAPDAAAGPDVSSMN